MSYTTPIQASQIKKGMYAILKGRPCKITHTSTSKTGKHGHAKVHFIGSDVFTNKKIEDICSSTHTMQQPILTKTEYELIGIDDGFLSLMDKLGSVREDIELSSSDINCEIKRRFDGDEEISVTLLSWGDIENAIIDFKKLN